MDRPKRILVVDDESEYLVFLQKHLCGKGYEVETAQDGIEALAKIKFDIDLVLLDIRMPGMDGYEVARRIRAEPEYIDIPIVMVTVLGKKEDRLRAVEAGASDFIEKPVDLIELHVRTSSLLKMKEARDALRENQENLEQKIQDRTQALREALNETVSAQRMTYQAQLETIHHLAVVAEFKDKDTAAHIHRVREYSALLAQGLNLPPGEVESIRLASPMHDVGKIVVPESVLLKSGKLSDDEWKVMKTHAEVGSRILGNSSSNLMHTAEEIARSHHEKWDGNGYPNGLSEGNIPITGRICAVADVFDALTSERSYKKAFSIEQTFEILREGRGEHFDPRIVDVFFKHRSAILEIHKKYRAEAV